MIRLLLSALVAGVLASTLLVQLSQTRELLAWELLLLALLVWLLRELPGRGDTFSRSLFDLDPADHTRLPRVVSTTELAVVDAVSGYVSPDRRLRPMLNRMASHRLARHGLTMDSPESVAKIGESNWLWLTSSSDAQLELDELERIVARLEDL
jgi:hypothetical protein